MERRLASKGAVADRVEVAVRGGEVTLDGTLATLWEKEWAGDRAMGTDGVGTVVNNLIIPSPETDKELGNAVGQAIVRYPYYSVFDYVDVTVENGVVTLRGDVTPRPDKPADLYERVSKVRGVQAIVNELEVLSPGIGDERLRNRLARELFGHSQFDRYLGLAPRLSIIVRNGYVTLKGVVYDQADRISRGEHRPPDVRGNPGEQRAADAPRAARGEAARGVCAVERVSSPWRISGLQRRSNAAGPS